MLGRTQAARVPQHIAFSAIVCRTKVQRWSFCSLLAEDKTADYDNRKKVRNMTMPYEKKTSIWTAVRDDRDLDDIIFEDETSVYVQSASDR